MKTFLKAAVAASALLIASQAHATDFHVGDNNADGSFTLKPGTNIFNGPITATLTSFVPAGSFTDRFIFTIPQNGVGTGSVTSSNIDLTSAVGLIFDSVYLTNSAGTFFASFSNPTPEAISAAIAAIPITSGVENILTIVGRSSGGSYGGTLTFQPVPEPATWAMLLAGFGMVGFAMRRRRATQKVQVSFG